MTAAVETQHLVAPLADMRLSGAGDDSACFKLFREQRDPQVVARFTIEGEPGSKSRARFTKAGSKSQPYTPEKTHAAEDEVARLFRATTRNHIASAVTTFGVVALFFPSTRQRRDVDNMLKLILDGLTGVAWQDDDQVVEVSGRKTLVPRGDARTEVVVYRVGLVQRPTAACGGCGTRYPTYESWTNKQFCSRTCRTETLREKRLRTCEKCSAKFEPQGGPGARAKYCSRTCADEARRTTVTCARCAVAFTKQTCHVREKNYCSAACRDAEANLRRQSKAKGVCAKCGGPTSKKTYAMCRTCRFPGEPAGKPAFVLGTPVRHTQIALHVTPIGGAL